jgi:hypothetical protein
MAGNEENQENKISNAWGGEGARETERGKKYELPGHDNFSRPLVVGAMTPVFFL